MMKKQRPHARQMPLVVTTTVAIVYSKTTSVTFSVTNGHTLSPLLNANVEIYYLCNLFSISIFLQMFYKSMIWKIKIYRKIILN